jgi:hypothetical protein
MMIPIDRIDSPRDDAWLRRLREPNEWWDAQYGRRQRRKQRRIKEERVVSRIVDVDTSNLEGPCIPPILIIAAIGVLAWILI